MPTPDDAPKPAADPYFGLVSDTFVQLYWRMRLLEEALDRLREHRYAVVVLDASSWATDEDFHRSIADGLEFPDYYGRNLDALNDCLRDVVDGDYGRPEDSAGLVLAFTHYDSFARASPRTAQVALDIIAVRARRAAIHSQRLLCLVHSDDPDILFEPVGATPVLWNRAEWLNARRGPQSLVDEP